MYLGRDDVTVIATLEPSDDEMARRVAKHQARCRAGWATLEEPYTLASAVAQVHTPAALIDCLSGFVSNLLLKYEDEGELAAIRRVLSATNALIFAAK